MYSFMQAERLPGLASFYFDPVDLIDSVEGQSYVVTWNATSSVEFVEVVVMVEDEVSIIS